MLKSVPSPQRTPLHRQFHEDHTLVVHARMFWAASITALRPQTKPLRWLVAAAAATSQGSHFRCPCHPLWDGLPDLVHSTLEGARVPSAPIPHRASSLTR